MSEITIEQDHYINIELDEDDRYVDIEQNGVYVRIERNSIAKLILALIKLHPDCRDEVSKGMDELK